MLHSVRTTLNNTSDEEDHVEDMEVMDAVCSSYPCVCWMHEHQHNGIAVSLDLSKANTQDHDSYFDFIRWAAAHQDSYMLLGITKSVDWAAEHSLLSELVDKPSPADYDFMMLDASQRSYWLPCTTNKCTCRARICWLEYCLSGAATRGSSPMIKVLFSAFPDLSGSLAMESAAWRGTLRVVQPPFEFSEGDR